MVRKLCFLLCLLSFSMIAFAVSDRVNSIQPTAEKMVKPTPLVWKDIKHVVIIVFENTSAKDALAQPFMKKLASKGAYLSQMYAITHPSQPNYIGLVAGSTLGVKSNSTVTVDALHVGDLLDAKGLSWKSYAENYPGNCYRKSTNGDYARKHEPFISFRTVQNNPAQCAKVVPGENFFIDVYANQLPTFSLYIPNNKNNGHDTGIVYADNWLKNTFSNVFSDAKILKDTLFIITFDEDDGQNGNRIYTVLFGAGVKPGVDSNVRYSLYSLLRTVEDIFDLGSLCQNDASAIDVSDVWLS